MLGNPEWKEISIYDDDFIPEEEQELSPLDDDFVRDEYRDDYTS